MTITIRQKALANDNISLYLDIYDGGKRKFEFLSLYLLPEVDAETKARNEETLQRAHQIRAERILHPETIPEVGHLMIVKEIPNDESPEVLDWIQTYIDWMSDNRLFQGYCLPVKVSEIPNERVPCQQAQTSHHSEEVRQGMVQGILPLVEERLCAT